MTKVTSRVGVGLSLGVMLVSAIANARYGSSLARDGIDAYLMIAAAVFADAGKAVCWIFFATALSRQQYLAAGVALVIFLACMTWAVAGSLGYMAMSRAQSTAKVEDRGADAKHLDDELRRKQARLAQSDQVEPSAVIAKRVEALRQDRRFATSNNCTDATVESSRSFCAALSKLEAEQKKAEANEKLEQEIKELRRERQAIGSVAVVERGDFQGSLIAQLTNLNLPAIQLSLTVVFVLMLESGACFLMWLSLNHAQPTQQEIATLAATNDAVEGQRKEAPKLDDVATVEVGQHAVRMAELERGVEPPHLSDFVAFIEDWIEVDDGGSCDVEDILTTYRTWCSSRKRSQLSDAMLAFALEQFCSAGSLRQEMRDGKFLILGIRLKRRGVRKIAAS